MVLMWATVVQDLHLKELFLGSNFGQKSWDVVYENSEAIAQLMETYRNNCNHFIGLKLMSMIMMVLETNQIYQRANRNPAYYFVLKNNQMLTKIHYYSNQLA